MSQNKYYLIGSFLLFLSLIFLFSGISYSIFNFLGTGMTNNVIQTGRIIFSYSDADGSGNGISIQNAIPIPDEQGKVLSGTQEYFDFTVSANTTSSNVSYEIAALKGEDSTLDEKYVKIYLTTLDGDTEQTTPITGQQSSVLTYANLTDTSNPLLSGKTIYYGSVSAGEVSYGKRFRLRMWVTDLNNPNLDYTEINDKHFSLKVSVAASSIY